MKYYILVTTTQSSDTVSSTTSRTFKSLDEAHKAQQEWFDNNNPGDSGEQSSTIAEKTITFEG